MKKGRQQLWNFTQFLDRSMISGLVVTIWGLSSPIPPIAKDLKHLHKRLIMVFWGRIYPMVCLFECASVFIRATQVLRFIIDSASWFENDTENIDDKVSMLYNICHIETLLRKSKGRIDQRRSMYECKWFIYCRGSEQI